MTAKEELDYLVEHFLQGSYDLNTFSDVYYDVYVHKLDIINLSLEEKHLYRKLFDFSSRSSEDKEDIEIRGFYSTEEVKEAAKEVYEKIIKKRSN